MRQPLAGLAGLVLAIAALAAAAPAQEPPEPAIVARVRAHLPELVARVEALRGQRFERPVEVRHETPAAFRAHMLRVLDAEYGEARARADARLLSAVGLIPAGLDLRAAYVDAWSAQVFAYYDPEQGAFLVLQGDLPDDQLRATIVHELAHALQDQRFDLDALQAPFRDPAFDREDAGLAMKFAIEGEATLLQTRFTLELKGQEALLDQEVRSGAETPRRQSEANLLRVFRQRGEAGEATVQALEAQARLPGYLYHTLVDPSLRGAALVHGVRRTGGWDAVDALFERLPASTEQALHPEKCGLEGRDEPTTFELPDVTEALGPGWTLLGKNTLGELNLRILFETLTGHERERAAAGWDGDRIHAYGEGQDTAFIWHLVWDSPAEAHEFTSELERALRGPQRPASLATADITTAGSGVTIIGGCPPGALESVRRAVSEGAPTSPRSR